MSGRGEIQYQHVLILGPGRNWSRLETFFTCETVGEVGSFETASRASAQELYAYNFLPASNSRLDLSIFRRHVFSHVGRKDKDIYYEGLVFVLASREGILLVPTDVKSFGDLSVLLSHLFRGSDGPGTTSSSPNSSVTNI